MDSRQVKYGPEAAVELARQAQHLWVAKGKNVKHVDLRQDDPSDEELVKLIVGPTGNLRAPTLRAGNKLLVGFHREPYEAELLNSEA